jgi:microcystin-dependent protein
MKTRPISVSLWTGIFSVLFLSSALRVSVQAQTAAKLLPFQGRLTDQNGVAVSNGARLVQFKIYDVPTGSSPVWAGELHRTTVNGGLVNVLLGSKTPLTGVDFDKQLYLEITVDVSGPTGQPDNAITAADPPMLPRQAILPIVFAKESADSRLLSGYDWGALFGTNNPVAGTLLDTKIRDGSIIGTKIQPASITAIQVAPGTITGSNIAANTISSSNIIPGTIDYSILARGVLEALNPAGAVTAFAGNPSQITPGWLLCDGRAMSSIQLPALYAAIGTNWGAGVAGSTNDFNLPDLRGLFLRGVDNSPSVGASGNDPESAARSAIKLGGNRGPNAGSYQSDDFKSHTHGVKASSFVAPESEGIAGYNVTSVHNRSHESLSTGGFETRPRNAYVNYIIKY